jgi:hypothetical protein
MFHFDDYYGLHEPVSCTKGSRLGFGCLSASFITSFLTIINPLLTSTYKTLFRIVDPMLMLGITLEVLSSRSPQMTR